MQLPTKHDMSSHDARHELARVGESGRRDFMGQATKLFLFSVVYCAPKDLFDIPAWIVCGRSNCSEYPLEVKRHSYHPAGITIS